MIIVKFTSAGREVIDTVRIRGAAIEGSRRVLTRFGALVRKIARNSIRQRKTTSPPGGPPYSKTGALRNFLRYAWDARAMAVVIGPEKLPKPILAPPVIEFGGTEPGNNRVVFITNEVGRDARGRFKSRGRTRVELKGDIHYKARPFMGPALKAAMPKLLPMWRDSVK